MISTLYNRINYKSDVKYIISQYVSEYDLQKADITILYTKGIIDKDKYLYLFTLPNLERNIQIGWLLRDNPRDVKILQEGIIEAKKMFFEANDIQDNDILSVKNDAVFLVNKYPTVTSFGDINFINKNTYTSFYQLKNIELYYYINMVNKTEILDIKGIRKERLELHENYFLEFLGVLLGVAETEDIKSAIDMLMNIYNKYVNLELDINYYRELNSDSMFHMKKLSKYHTFKAEFLPKEQLRNVDISYNLGILMELHQVLSGIHFSRRR